ncbi:uncharacterized protein LOC115629291 [Scaptodrosophila lebanonensis]|uniref:Uncharacterized protein LOC115629291 n=1 Tax=Drosophila lebanonensis TaxID=7225 RepID=A0A6J2TYI2_DROLE|nr:uncharacterized protein LOC115629291 [Scaptodrosophila lebanonensis]
MTKLSETKIPMNDFLIAYRSQPSLYNSLLDTYKNRTSREEAYKAIIKSLKIPQLTVLDIKLKIKSIRTVYTKELRILMREKEQGRPYEPKLFWFKLADSFLRAVSLSHCKRIKNKHTNSPANLSTKQEMQTRKSVFNTTSNIMDEDALEGEQEDDHIEEPYANIVDNSNKTNSAKPALIATSSVNNNHHHGNSCIISISSEDVSSIAMTSASTASVSLPRTPNKTELIIDDSSLCMMEQQQHQHEPAPQRKLNLIQQQRVSATSFALPSQQQKDMSLGNVEDDLVVFGQSIASQLRSITDAYSRSVAKLRIQQVLFEAETGQLQSNEAVGSHLHTF